MTHHLACVTNDLELVHPTDRPRPCIVRGVHRATCENPDDCRGCVTRDAEVGHLCRVCWEKLQDALSRVENLTVHLRSIEKAAQPISERVDTSKEKRLILPDSWVAADGLMEALGAPPIPSTATIDDAVTLARDAVSEWADPEAIVQSREGAKRAVVLVKRMQTALKRWPDSEVELRHIPWVLCPNCRKQHLWRRAPLEYGDEIRVECGTDDLGYEPGLGYDRCEWSLDWFVWLDRYGPIIEHIFKEQDRAEKALKRNTP